MKSLDAHESEAVVDAAGSVRVGQVPFATGDRVRVLILRDPARSHQHTPDEIRHSQLIRQGLQGTVHYYDRPDEPVAANEWDATRDDDGPAA